MFAANSVVRNNRGTV